MASPVLQRQAHRNSSTTVRMLQSSVTNHHGPLPLQLLHLLQDLGHIRYPLPVFLLGRGWSFDNLAISTRLGHMKLQSLHSLGQCNPEPFRTRYSGSCSSGSCPALPPRLHQSHLVFPWCHPCTCRGRACHAQPRHPCARHRSGCDGFGLRHVGLGDKGTKLRHQRQETTVRFKTARMSAGLSPGKVRRSKVRNSSMVMWR